MKNGGAGGDRTHWYPEGGLVYSQLPYHYGGRTVARVTGLEPVGAVLETARLPINGHPQKRRARADLDLAPTSTSCAA